MNREVGFLKHVFNVAIRDGKTDRNPVSKVRMLKEPSGRVRYLSDEEEMRLMSALATDSERERIRFLVQTGLRKSEFANLRWKDVAEGRCHHHPTLEERGDMSRPEQSWGGCPVLSILQCLCF